jgi:hypothetical protein
MGIQTRRDRQRFSRLRQALVRLRDEVLRLVEPFLSSSGIVAGSVYEIRRRCGKPGCRCASGEHLHARMVISSKQGGKTRLRVVPRGSLVEVQRKAEEYRRLRQARARLRAVHSEMLGVMDVLERMRRDEVK